VRGTQVEVLPAGCGHGFRAVLVRETRPNGLQGRKGVTCHARFPGWLLFS
jgi:hypothetical protein